MTLKLLSMLDSRIAFLDGDVLARPVTRTLVILTAQIIGPKVTWSHLAEVQGNRNSPPAAKSVTWVRNALGRELSPTGKSPERFIATSTSDQQILADAEAAGAMYLVTGNVEDFDVTDLDALGITAVNPDLFLSTILNADAYLDVISQIAKSRKNPPQTAAYLHGRLARQHPRTVGKFAALFPSEFSPPTHLEPSTLFRGHRCIECGNLPNQELTLGLCTDCQLD